jgi:hypothetical protein
MKRSWATVVAGVVVLCACAKKDEIEAYRELAQETKESQATYATIPVDPVNAYRIVVTVGGKDVEVIHTTDGVWQPGMNATTNSAGLVADGESILLPTTAYRRFEADRSDPEFGFATPQAILLVETRLAEQFRLTIGNPTLNNGGYYAVRDGDPFTYVIVPQVLDYALGILEGERVVRPADPKFVQALDRLEDASVPEEVTNPWLKQVIEAGDD